MLASREIHGLVPQSISTTLTGVDPHWASTTWCEPVPTPTSCNPTELVSVEESVTTTGSVHRPISIELTGVVPMMAWLYWIDVVVSVIVSDILMGVLQSVISMGVVTFVSIRDMNGSGHHTAVRP